MIPTTKISSNAPTLLVWKIGKPHYRYPNGINKRWYQLNIGEYIPMLVCFQFFLFILIPSKHLVWLFHHFMILVGYEHLIVSCFFVFFWFLVPFWYIHAMQKSSYLDKTAHVSILIRIIKSLQSLTRLTYRNNFTTLTIYTLYIL